MIPDPLLEDDSPDFGIFAGAVAVLFAGVALMSWRSRWLSSLFAFTLLLEEPGVATDDLWGDGIADFGVSGLFVVG